MAERGEIGHNSDRIVDANHLREMVERIEKLEEEKKATADDIKEVYLEARGAGFDANTLRRITFGVCEW